MSAIRDAKGPSAPHLKALDRLVHGGLPEVPEGTGRGPGFVNWPVDRGTAMSWDMPTHMQPEECGVAETFLTMGTEFPYHSHQTASSKETLICLRGLLVVRFEDKESVTLQPGDSVHIEPEAVHSVVAPEEDSWLLAVTVPRDPGFPG